ncbi:MAG: hypothetical protein M1816_002797 [Peltula sp. TS41687]|nr:MAG: hypothetical protein M1816_002797 [Peltula sp. TS41687]
MSEYWKSTPKYWCKHCKTHVRDTKIERTNHEATGKHQGNLKRFLRDLHRGHEREEREKDKAKAEVERLNGIVSGDPTTGPPWKRREANQQFYPAQQRQVTAEERMQQMSQLADMGVSIPQEFRGNMAMAGEWQTVSEKVVSGEKSEMEDSKERVRTDGTFRKRKYFGEGDDGDGEGQVESSRRKNWGSTTKSYPSVRAEDDDLEALLRGSKPSQQSSRMMEQPVGGIKEEVSAEITSSSTSAQPSNQAQGVPALKTEPSDGQDRDPFRVPDVNDVKGIDLKQESDGVLGDVHFKKRKAKNIRQK